MYVAIISIAQHASPNVIGHSDDFRAAASTASAGTCRIPGRICRYSAVPGWYGAGVSSSCSRSTPVFSRCGATTGAPSTCFSGSAGAAPAFLRHYFCHCRTPFFHAYPNPAARMPMNITISQNADLPAAEKTTAHGNRNTASTSKIRKRMANR